MGAASSTAPGTAADRLVNKSTIINVWLNNGTTKNYFWTDTFIKVFLEAPIVTLWTVFYEYYTNLWCSFFFIISFPITFIIAVAQDWSLSKVTYSETVDKYGTNFIQYFLINNIDKVIQYHWMVWGGDYGGITRFFYMWLRLLYDILTAATGIVGLTLGFPINCVFWIFTLVMWDNDAERIAYLKYLGFPNGGTTFYKMGD